MAKAVLTPTATEGGFTLWAGDGCSRAISHSDIGGYTSLHGDVRTAELLMRWSELAAFTPVMRTHEGNRPTRTC